MSLDQIQNNRCLAFPFSDHRPFKQKNEFSPYLFQFSKRNWRNGFARIMCSSLVQAPKPQFKPRAPTIVVDVEERTNRMKIPSAGLCSQIEKLVLCAKFREALELFEIIEISGRFDIAATTYDAIVSACIALKSFEGAKRVSRYMLHNGFEPDLHMKNRVLLMNVKCGKMDNAGRLFREMPNRNLTSWSTMISGFVEVGKLMEAFQLFIRMRVEYSEGGALILATMIRASAKLEMISAGKQLHACTFKMGIADDKFVSLTLIDMYSKCGSIEDAHFVFEQMPVKSIVGWNSVIAGYALHGYSEEALDIYYEMRDSGVQPDHYTLSIIIRICTRLASLESGKQAHAALLRNGFGSNIVANTALVDFYCKWGRLENARHVFDKMPSKNILTWNALIAGYGKHGRGAQAVELFESMLKENMKPDHITFLAVLSACSYAGLSERGWQLFNSMERDHKIIPKEMHYECMIELLGKEGLLDEALDLIQSAPFEPNVNMWAALLIACRVNKNFALGKFAAEKLYETGPVKLGNYVMLLNVYKKCGNLKDAAAVVQSMKRKGLGMRRACSWIEIKSKPYAFFSGDKHHVHKEAIYQKVDELMLEISKLGYLPHEKTLLPDVDEEEERDPTYHSEKLAIAFGLLSTPHWASLQVVQGHRMCADCHTAVKLITVVSRREIVLKDYSRFHHFKDGICSCGDYW